MLLGILTLLGSTLLSLFGTQYWILSIARLLLGLSDACVWTLAFVLVSDTFPENELGTQVCKIFYNKFLPIPLVSSPVMKIFLME